MGTEADVDGGGNPYDAASGNRNDWTVDEAQIKVADVDMLVRIRDDRNDTINRSVWIPNCKVQTINWSYSVDGNATENVTLRGDTDRHFIGEYRQITVEIGTYNTSSTFDVTTDGANHTELYYTVNGTVYDASTVTSWTAGLVTVTAPTLADGDRIRFIFYLTTADDDYTELDTVGIGAIKAPYVVIGLGDADFISSGSKTLRLQSVDINVNVTREDLKEIGTEDLIGSPMQKQDVTIDATVLEEDMENLAKMMGVTSSEWANRDTTGVEFKLQDSIGNLNDLFVKIYDDSSQTTLLKTFEANSLALLNNPFSQDVGALGQYTLSFRCDNWQWTGNGDGGRLATSYPTGYPTNPDKGS